MKNGPALSSLPISLATATWLIATHVSVQQVSAQHAIWELGTLTCSLVPEVQLTPGEPRQGREALCHFRPGNKGAEETYVGTFQFIGQGKVPSGNQTIMLVVKAPISRMITPGLLQQAYSADASTGAVKQAPLIGARNSAIVLQTASEQSDLPTMALGQSMPGTIIIAELKLTASPA
jgi:hypothetical protein